MYYLRKRFQNIDFAKTNYALFIEKNNCPSYKYLFAKKESFIRLWMLFKENHNTRWVMSSKRRTVPIMLFFLESALISWSCPYNSITQSLMATFHLTSILSFLALWSKSCGATFQLSLFVFEMRSEIWGSLRETKDQAFAIRIGWKLRFANRYLWTPLAN